MTATVIFSRPYKKITLEVTVHYDFFLIFEGRIFFKLFFNQRKTS